ncbi:cupin domain-containing protein [Mariluticola halotolerans]|uniref:cupin domain-containing protein n=1 Tax=Mariluticola halotolerans TaxID=2909283 RepID=UPI0026E491EF|nr:cupin domain-containing protein [Mariluticola halotolerans]UJQ94706.1 cupin domain-containing protein [Mariluticola halotolerans]
MERGLGALRTFNVIDTLAGHPPRTNFNMFRLDGAYNMRIARVEGRFPWHRHTNGDEGWLVLKGRLRIDVEGEESQEMGALEGTMIPKGLVHSPIALEEDTVVAVFNIDKFAHEYVEPEPDLQAFNETDVK